MTESRRKITSPIDTDITLPNITVGRGEVTVRVTSLVVSHPFPGGGATACARGPAPRQGSEGRAPSESPLGSVH